MESNSIKIVKLTVLLVAALFIATGWMVSIQADSEGSRILYTDHVPISINGDLELQNMASIESWPGSGSEIDPFIISSYHIDGTGSEFGISLTDIGLHLHIRGNLIDDTLDGNGIFVRNSDNVVIQDNRIKDSGSSRNIYVIGSNSIVISGNRLEGNHSTHSIQVRNSKNIEINSNDLLWNDGNGIYASYVEGLRIIDNEIVNVNYTGIVTSNSKTVLMEGNMVQDCGTNGIAISPSDSEINLYDNRLNGCDFEIGSLATTLITPNNTIDGIPVRQYSGVDLTGTPIPHSTSQFFLYNVTGFEINEWNYSMPYDPIYAWNSDDMMILNCTFKGAGLGLHLHYCDDMELRGNLFWNLTDRAVHSFYGTEYMITENIIGETPKMLYLGQGGDITLSENMIDVVHKGLEIVQLDGLNLVNNTITGGASLVGVNLIQVDDPLVSGNSFLSYHGDALLIIHGEMGIVSGNNLEGIGTGYGINITSTNNMIFERNLVSGFENGFELSYQSTDSAIINNRIEDNTGNGIRIRSAMDYDIERNLIFNNTGFGVDIDGSSSCLVHNNSFIENRGSDDSFSSLNIQARDDSNNNLWNGSTHGNYWRDLESEDVNGDGILEDPYLIFGTTSYDNKPLAEPSYEYLSEPEGLTIHTMKDSILLEWSPPEIDIDGSLAGYILRRTGGSGPELESDLAGTSLSYLDEDVEDGMTYSYSLAGINRYGEGSRTSVLEGTPDSTAPLVSFISPSDGTITTDNDIGLAWETSDNVGVVLTEIRMNDGQWFDVGMNTSYEALNLTEGLNHFYLRSFDALGNNGTDQVNIIIDMTDPEVEILAPENGTITSQRTIVVDWGGADLVTNIARYLIRVDEGNWLDVGNNSRWNITLENDGTHIIYVMAEDLAGNSAVDSIEVKLDTTGPDVFFTSPAEGYNTTDSSLKVSWIAYDTFTGISSYSISLDNGVEVTLDALVKEYTFTSLDVGVHKVYLTAFDAAGNPSSIEVSFTILDPNIEPTLTIIRGLVTDEYGEPLHNVKVISENGYETRTDSNGYFALEVERGSVILTFKKKGYRDLDELVEADPFPANDSLMIQLEKVKEEPGFFSSLFERTFCQVCCVAAVVIPLLLFVLGLIRRSRTKKRKRMKKEKKMVEE